MKVTAHFHGILADWVGTRSADFELSYDATYSDLIKEIRRRFGGNIFEGGSLGIFPVAR